MSDWEVLEKISASVIDDHELTVMDVLSIGSYLIEYALRDIPQPDARLEILSSTMKTIEHGLVSSPDRPSGLLRAMHIAIETAMQAVGVPDDPCAVIIGETPDRK